MATYDLRDPEAFVANTDAHERRSRMCGSPFNGKVAVDKVAAMSHSCGELQTVKVSTDPRITTAVVLNSGMITDDDQSRIGGPLRCVPDYVLLATGETLIAIGAGER